MRQEVVRAPEAHAAAEAGRRIETLDILRGFALFGMILVHFHQGFRLSSDVESFIGEKYIGWVVWLGVEQKAWATFAFLFGVGFAILMRRAEARGQRLVPLYLRRLAVLAAIGAVIHVFTGFQMLMEYALWGVPLLFLRHRSTSTLLLVAVVAAMASPVLTLGQGIHELLTLGRSGADADAAWQARQDLAPAEAEAQNYRHVVVQRLATLPPHLRHRLVPGSSFSLFLIGLLAVRHRVLDAPRRHLRLIGTMMGIGVLSWLLFWLLLPRMPMDFSSRRVVMPIRYGMGLVSDQWLAFTYIGGLVLLLAYRPRWITRLAPLGVAGRMALTNYALQCAVFEYLSSPFGLNLKLRPYYYAFGAVLLFAIEVAISRAWLSRFRFGPLEWVWRSLTYMRWQPLRIGGREHPESITAAG